MSEQEGAKIPPRVLADADVFFSFLVSDELSQHSERLLHRSEQGLLKIQTASEIYDDIITALRSDGASIELMIDIISDLRKIAHETLPTTIDVASEAMRLYSQYGGQRRLHYFDAFHVATAKLYELPLVTSDRYILQNSARLGLTSLDLRRV